MQYVRITFLLDNVFGVCDSTQICGEDTTEILAVGVDAKTTQVPKAKGDDKSETNKTGGSSVINTSKSDVVTAERKRDASRSNKDIGKEHKEKANGKEETKVGGDGSKKERKEAVRKVCVLNAIAGLTPGSVLTEAGRLSTTNVPVSTRPLASHLSIAHLSLSRTHSAVATRSCLPHANVPAGHRHVCVCVCV